MKYLNLISLFFILTWATFYWMCIQNINSHTKGSCTTALHRQLTRYLGSKLRKWKSPRANYQSHKICTPKDGQTQHVDYGNIGWKSFRRGIKNHKYFGSHWWHSNEISIVFVPSRLYFFHKTLFSKNVCLEQKLPWIQYENVWFKYRKTFKLKDTKVCFDKY